MRIPDPWSRVIPRIRVALAALAILGGVGLVGVACRIDPPGAPDAIGGSFHPSTDPTSPGGAQSTSSTPRPSASRSPSGRPTTSAGAAPGRPAAPGPAGWPNAATTGVPTGHTLKSSAAIRVTKAGTVIDGMDVHGDISVEASNVTIKNTRVRNAGTWAIIQRSGASGLTVQDCDVAGNGTNLLQFAVLNQGGPVTLLRNDFSVVSDAISTSSGLIADNYLHDPKYFSGDHTDMIQSDSGPGSGQQLVIRHNTIINTLDQTSAVALFQDFGVQHDALIEGNLLAGGGYVLYGGAGAKGTSYNIRVVNNVFSRQVFPKGGSFGPVAYWDSNGSGNVWQSNVWQDTGAAVTP